MLHLTHEAFDKLYEGMPKFREAVDKTVAERLESNESSS